MNPLLLELIRQVLRWLGVLMMQTPWIPSSIVALTTNEEIILWFAGLASYAVADTGWLVAKWKQWRGRK
jgi:hypothetical protein